MVRGTILLAVATTLFAIVACTSLSDETPPTAFATPKPAANSGQALPHRPEAASPLETANRPAATSEPLRSDLSYIDRVTVLLRPSYVPSDLQMASMKAPASGPYYVRFTHPQRTANRGGVAGSLVSVASDIVFLANREEAGENYEAQGGLNIDELGAVILDTEEGASDVVVETVPSAIPGVQRQHAFHLTYTRKGAPVHEYRYRVLVGPAVANITVTAAALVDGREPELLAISAPELVATQIQRIEEVLE